MKANTSSSCILFAGSGLIIRKADTSGGLGLRDLFEYPIVQPSF
jgi:hypothetical protein